MQVRQDVDAGRHDSDVPHDVELDKVTDFPVVRARYPWRVVAAVVVALLLVLFIRDALTNPRWDWPTFRAYVFSDPILSALLVTLQLTALSAVFGFFGGVVLALMRMSGNRVLQLTSWGFTWLFRSIPLVVLLLLWGNLAYLYPTLGLSLPFGPSFQVETVTLISSFGAAIIGLSFHHAAYSGEIVRSGLLSVDQGQIEAAQSLGIPVLRRFRRIVLPQAMRSIIPTAANQTITLLKESSVVFVLAIGDLFYQVMQIYGINGRIVPLLMVATFWYVTLVAVLSIVQYYIERHYAKGAVRNLPSTPLQRLRRGFTALNRRIPNEVVKP